MAFTNETTHYGLPQWIGSDKPTYLVDQNNAYQTIDSEIYNANVTAGEAVTTANGASATAGAASATAADALSAAQTASTTADSALAAAQDAGTIAQAAQTAAGAAQTAAEAAQQAAAGNSITNLAPAYDSTITYAIDDLVTQDGKLYKCIVAVASPEQFDINKWDDVTTSEVYARAGANVYTKAEVNALTNGYILTGTHRVRASSNSTTTTFAELMDSLYNAAVTYVNSLDNDVYYQLVYARITGNDCKFVTNDVVSKTNLSPLEENIYMMVKLGSSLFMYDLEVRSNNASKVFKCNSDGSVTEVSSNVIGYEKNIDYYFNLYRYNNN